MASKPPAIAVSSWKLNLVLVVASAVVVSGSVPASAESCHQHPYGSPEAIVSGTETLSTGDPFFTTYDFAIVGSVEGVIPSSIDDDGNAVGPMELVFTVLAVFGTGDAVAELAVTEDDPGYFSGYGYEVGGTYFVPIQAVSASGSPNYSYLCDPITRVDDPPVGQWVATALGAGIPAAVPSEPDAGTAPVSGTALAQDESASHTNPAISTLFSIVLLATFVLVIVLRSLRTRRYRRLP